jgi:hypothetical protein
MGNEYFIPDIEDIYIGYELEHLSANGYIETKFEINSSLHALQELIKLNQIRVPYLTKEQIESEGWKFDYNLGDFDYYIKTVNDTNYELEFCYKERININEYKFTLYHGECKDINTFRKIIKLLEI